MGFLKRSGCILAAALCWITGGCWTGEELHPAFSEAAMAWVVYDSGEQTDEEGDVFVAELRDIVTRAITGGEMPGLDLSNVVPMPVVIVAIGKASKGRISPEETMTLARFVTAALTGLPAAPEEAPTPPEDEG